MEFHEYSYRHGKELLQLTHPTEYNDIKSVLASKEGFPHGSVKSKTPKDYIASEFVKLGWEKERKIPLGTHKSDYCDIVHNRVAIEQEYSRFEMFFRDFFRFLLLYDQREIDIGVIITYDDAAFKRWGGAVPHYSSARASLQKLKDFLEGRYSTLVHFPLWCIGIE
jgi:hypothetical protein|tara:strand:+ start:50 stop:547 length:498 start_codon:yes stop_codon:yes gene_type:complete